VIVGFVLVTLVGRQKLSGIHRFIANRVDWLGELTKIEAAKPISRANLPRCGRPRHARSRGASQAV
jgi:hypothetical protein